MTTDVQAERDLPVGLPIYTADGHHIGEVKEVVGSAFKVNVSLSPDYWLATSCIADVDEDRYTLAIPAEQVHEYHVPDPHDDELDDAGGFTGRAGVHSQSTAAAGLLVPDPEDERR